MNPQLADRLHFDQQLAYARPVVALMALVCVVELRPLREVERPVSFLVAYLVLSVVIMFLEPALRRFGWHLPLICDILVLAIILYLSPILLPAGILLCFVSFIAGYRWNAKFALFLCFGLVLLGVALGFLRDEDTDGGSRILLPVLLATATFLVAASFAFLGDRNRRFAEQQEFLARLMGTVHVELGLAESLRQLLEELASEFRTEQAMLAYRDSDLDRMFIWHVRSGESERIVPENLPVTRADGFLLDDLDYSLCWNSMEGRGSGFGWLRKTRAGLRTLPRIPGPTATELGIRNFLTVVFEQENKAAGRLFLFNRKPGAGAFTHEELIWFERLSKHIGPAIENVFLLRHLRARAIEAERSRIARDLHDGILQTLLSIEIQIDVMRRKVTAQPEQVETGLASLQQTVKNEGGELRHMVTDLRPLRVQSADMVDLMRGFGERYRNESGLAMDLLIDSVELHAPDRVCREVFQIYREALNNIKKHAKASHVVVKLSQDDSRLVLVVDDNGEGFSFAGRFTGDELDRLRLGPISIKERTRTVGGILTIESNPGHGARLTIEVPLG
jgi:signal transduction histidine kinase